MRNGKLMTTKVAAIALSSMMVLSPLTAFASSNNPNPPQIKDPYGETIQDDKGFLTDAGGYINGTRDFAANFKKSLELVDIKNTGYTPSVPDVRFTYKITSGTDKDAAMAAVASYNGATVFAGDAAKHIKTVDLLVDFRHGDTADGDVVMKDAQNKDLGKGKDDGVKNVMTRLIDFTIDEASFDGMDPGVYRFRLTEGADVIDLDENGAVETKTAPEDVKDDTEATSDKYSTRYIDVAIGRASSSFSDTKRIIQGVILHEVTVTKRDGDPIKISEKKSEGYVPTSYDDEDEKEKYTETGKPKHYSRYDTFDLLVDKEVFGQGLTQENAEKAYKIDITLFGPVGTEVMVVKMNGGTSSKAIDTRFALTDAANGDVINVELKNNEWIEISGLPAGSEYTVKEQDASKLSEIYTKVNAEKTDVRTFEENGVQKTVKAITMDAADELVANKGVDHDKAIELATAAGAGKNGTEHEKILKINRYFGNNDEMKAAAEALNKIDVNNVLIANEQKPITVTGVVMNVAPYALMVIAAAIFAGLFISKKRQEEEI